MPRVKKASSKARLQPPKGTSYFGRPIVQRTNVKEMCSIHIGLELTEDTTGYVESAGTPVSADEPKSVYLAHLCDAF
jgi:hypothetical protein